jgi:hypothetical protein
MRPTPSFRPRFPRPSSSSSQQPGQFTAPSDPGKGQVVTSGNFDQPPGGQPASGQSGVQPPSPGQPYDFITNPSLPESQNMLQGASPAGKLLLSIGALFVLLVIFLLIRGIFGGKDFTPMINIGADQQEMIGLVTFASQQGNQQAALSVNNQNFTYTAKSSLTSAQTNLIGYLALQHAKVSKKLLNGRVDPSLEERLTSAAAAATYNQTFKDIMNDQLNTYSNDLKKAYNLTTGPNGRALLRDQFDQAQLLSRQLNTPGN